MNHLYKRGDAAIFCSIPIDFLELVNIINVKDLAKKGYRTVEKPFRQCMQVHKLHTNSPQRKKKEEF